MNQPQFTRRAVLRFAGSPLCVAALPLLPLSGKNDHGPVADEPIYLGRPLRELVEDMFSYDRTPLPSPMTPATLGQINELSEALGCIGMPAMPHLKTALQSDSEDVRRIAVSALGKVGSPAIPLLVAALDDPDYFIEICAVDELAAMATTVPLEREVFVRLLDRTRPAAFLHAIFVWWVRGSTPAGAVPFLADALQDQEVLREEYREHRIRVKRSADDLPLRIDITDALGCAGPPAYEPLERASRHARPKLRAAAARALGQVLHVDPRALAPLERLLHDDEPLVRIGAAEAILYYDSNRSDARDVKEATIREGGIYKRTGAKVPPAAAKAKSRRQRNRLGPGTLEANIRIAFARTSRGDPSGLAWLKEILSDGHPSTQAAVVDTYYYSHRPEAAPVQNRNNSGIDGTASALSAELAEMVQGLIGALVEVLRRGRRRTKHRDDTIIWALGAAGPDAIAAVPVLFGIAMQRWPQCDPGYPAALALGRIGDAGIAPLIQALRSPSVRFRVTAARALGCIGPAASAALPALQHASRDLDLAISVAAEKALQKIPQTQPGFALQTGPNDMPVGRVFSNPNMRSIPDERNCGKETIH